MHTKQLTYKNQIEKSQNCKKKKVIGVFESNLNILVLNFYSEAHISNAINKSI